MDFFLDIVGGAIAYGTRDWSGVPMPGLKTQSKIIVNNRYPATSSIYEYVLATPDTGFDHEEEIAAVETRIRELFTMITVLGSTRVDYNATINTNMLLSLCPPDISTMANLRLLLLVLDDDQIFASKKNSRILHKVLRIIIKQTLTMDDHVCNIQYTEGHKWKLPAYHDMESCILLYKKISAIKGKVIRQFYVNSPQLYYMYAKHDITILDTQDSQSMLKIKIEIVVTLNTSENLITMQHFLAQRLHLPVIYVLTLQIMVPII